MYVCICKAVTDTDINKAIDQGAHKLAHLEESCGVGTGCGCCRETAQRLIDDRLAELSYDAA